MVTDPIADFLTRIRNAQMAGHRVVDIPASNLKKRMTEILYNQGYILKYKFEDDNKQGVIKIALKYDAQTKQPAIQSMERISRPGLRQYAKPGDIRRVKNGLVKTGPLSAVPKTGAKPIFDFPSGRPLGPDEWPDP